MDSYDTPKNSNRRHLIFKSTQITYMQSALKKNNQPKKAFTRQDTEITIISAFKEGFLFK